MATRSNRHHAKRGSYYRDERGESARMAKDRRDVRSRAKSNLKAAARDYSN